jgi:hypothetical protein
VAPLKRVLLGDDPVLREAAVEALDQLDWAPERNPAGAVYWMAKGRWDQAAEIGAPAFEPVLAATWDKQKDVRQSAVQALGQIGDARALDTLVLFMDDDVAAVRQAAARSLGQIGGPAALKALLSAANHSTARVRVAATCGLGEIGGDPALGEAAVRRLIALLSERTGSVRQAATAALGEIGGDPALRETAIEALARLLEDAEGRLRSTVVQSLDKLGWAPEPSLAGARYWLHKGDWKKCAEMGAQGVRLYLDTLDADARSTRQVAARALVQIYRSGGLPEGSRQRILEHRGRIVAKHRDESKYTSVAVNTGGGCMEDNYDVVCRLSGFHVDRTIGVEFPL